MGLFLGAGAGHAENLDLESWSTVRTAHFTVRSDAERERAVEIAYNLERFRAVFSQLAPDFELKSPVPTRILAFRDEDSYTPFKSGRDTDRAKILGQFLGHRDGNFITLNADPKHLNGLGVVLHEYVHYFVQHNLPGVPRWFNEGLAEYYSTFAADERAAVVGLPVERHLHWIRTHDELGLEDVIETSGRQVEFHGSGGAEQAGQFYAVSWGLVHYLLAGDEDNAVALADFFGRVATGEPPSDAFEEAFDLDLDDLESRLHEYFLQPQLPAARLALDEIDAGVSAHVAPTPPAELLTLLAELSMHQGLEQRAETYFNLALDYEPEHADAVAGLAYVRNQQSRLEEAQVLFEQALELGPRQARSYLIYGRHLLTVMRQAQADRQLGRAGAFAERARGAFRAAADLDPDFAEAQAMFGYAHLFVGPNSKADPAKGVAPLERARKLLPGRPDVVFHLIQLRLRLGEFDRARRLTDRVLVRLGDQELVFRAREEIDRAELIQAANVALRDGDTDQGLKFLDDAIAVTSDPEIRARLEADLRRIQDSLER